MSFTFNKPRKLDAEEVSPWANLMTGVLKSYEKSTKAQYLKPNLEEALKKSKLFNDYYGQDMDSKIGFRSAQAGHLGSLTEGQNIQNQFAPTKYQQEEQKRGFDLDNPLFGSAGTSGDLGRLLYLQKMQKENPKMADQIGQQTVQQGQGQESFMPSINPTKNNQQPQERPPTLDMNQMIQDAIIKVSKGTQHNFAPSNTLKNLEALAQAEKGINPSTQMPFSNEEEKNSYVDALREKTTGLSKGKHYVYDPETHEKIGIERPTTNDEKKTEAGRAFFNDIMPTVRTAEEFSGKGSIERFDKYVNEYGKNPVATKKIDDLLVAQRLLSAGVVNEAATLGAGKQREVFRALKGSLSTMDIPERIQALEKGFKLPAEANIKASVRAQKIINDATQRASKSVPAMRTEYYHPEKYLRTKSQKESAIEEHGNNNETIEITNKKTGERKTVSVAEARKLGVPNV